MQSLGKLEQCGNLIYFEQNQKEGQSFFSLLKGELKGVVSLKVPYKIAACALSWAQLMSLSDRQSKFYAHQKAEITLVKSTFSVPECGIKAIKVCDTACALFNSPAETQGDEVKRFMTSLLLFSSKSIKIFTHVVPEETLSSCFSSTLVKVSSLFNIVVSVIKSIDRGHAFYEFATTHDFCSLSKKQTKEGLHHLKKLCSSVIKLVSALLVIIGCCLALTVPAPLGLGISIISLTLDLLGIALVQKCLWKNEKKPLNFQNFIEIGPASEAI